MLSESGQSQKCTHDTTFCSNKQCSADAVTDGPGAAWGGNGGGRATGLLPEVLQVS